MKREGKKKKGIGILTKMVLMCALPMIILEVIITMYSMNALRKGMQTEAFLGLNLFCQSVISAYDALDSGDYHMERDMLYKGEYCITAEEGVIDSFVIGSDADVTMFYNDTRRATSLLDKKSGERIIGTTASDIVVDTVLKKGEDYSTANIMINNEKYYAYYKPLRNNDGQIIGMVFAGEPSADVDSVIAARTSGIIGIAIVILIISLIMCNILVRRIATIVVHAGDMIVKVSDGDLRMQLSGKAERISKNARKRRDEIGMMVSSIYRLMEKLRSMTGNIKDTTNNLLQSGDSLKSLASHTNITANEIGYSVGDIAKSAVTQAEYIESATMQITHMGAMIESIVHEVQTLDKVSKDIKSADARLEQIINELETSNNKTLEAIKKIDASVHMTNEAVRKIQETVDLITAIASETNLLALNASIEATRAGEAGRGFAVVASQVSKLSEDSNNSAKTIEDIIQQLSASSEASVEIMARARDIIAEQQEKFDETKEKFADVSKCIEISITETENIYVQTKDCDKARIKVTDLIQNLSAIADQNAVSTQKTNVSMEEMNATINLLAKSAKDLKEIAEELERDVSFFNI